MDSSGRWTRLVWALLLVEVLATVADLVLGPWSRVHWEERFNARGGVLFACGHLEQAFRLQYRTFCGGCTAEGFAAAPLFRGLGATVMTWKLVPAGIHLAIVGLGALVARASAPRPQEGDRAAAAWLALMIAAPGFYRDLALTGWGNHAESTVFPLAGMAALALAAGRGALARGGAALLAGAVGGFGFWFCHTSGHALPALALAALLLSWRALPLFAAGAAAGLTPWWLYHRDRPQALEYARTWVPHLEPAPPSALWDWLAGPYLRQGLWAAEDFGAVGPLAAVWWALLWAVAAAGLWVAVRRWRGAAQPGVLLFGPLSLAALLAAYALRYDLWSNLPDVSVNAAFNLRYRTPLVPTLALCAALATAAPGRVRALSAAVVAALLLSGAALRVSTWDEIRAARFDLRVYAHNGWPDRTVPLGRPPQELPRKQGRLQDVEAALTFLGDHDDPLPDCRLAHVHELGRRLGIGLAGPQPPDAVTWLSRAEAALRDDEERRRVADGLVRSLIAPDGRAEPALGATLAALQAARPDLADAVGRAAGRRLFETATIKDELDPRGLIGAGLAAGVCEARGTWAVERRTDLGLRRATLEPRADGTLADGALFDPAEVCAGDAAFHLGLGRTWARDVGCDPEDEALLAAHSAHPAAHDGWQAGCLTFR